MPKKRPTAAELAAMSDADFGAFIRASGIKTTTNLYIDSHKLSTVVERILHKPKDAP